MGCKWVGDVSKQYSWIRVFMMPWLDSLLLRELDQDHDSGVILALEMGEWEPMVGRAIIVAYSWRNWMFMAAGSIWTHSKRDGRVIV